MLKGVQAQDAIERFISKRQLPGEGTDRDHVLVQGDFFSGVIAKIGIQANESFSDVRADPLSAASHLQDVFQPVFDDKPGRVDVSDELVQHLLFNGDAFFAQAGDQEMEVGDREYGAEKETLLRNPGQRERDVLK